MKQQLRGFWPIFACYTASLITACRTGPEDIGRLPDGKHPITFTASVESLTVTRGTTDNNWENINGHFAVQSEETVKQYIVTSPEGKLNSNDPLYWNSPTMDITAWYPYSPDLPGSFTIQSNQTSNSGYQNSDFLYASKTLTFDKSTPPHLGFRHLPVKVVTNLKSGDGITAEQIRNATVSFVNVALTSGAIAPDGSVAQTTNGNAVVLPQTVAATEGYQKSVRALLVPGRIQDKQFIRITVEGKNYFYMPKNETEADFVSGNLYTYFITVKKSGLTVTVENNGSQWTENPGWDQPATDAVFQVSIPSVSGLELHIDNATLKEGNHYEITGNSFSITYDAPAGGEMKGFISRGICKTERTIARDGSSYTFTFTDIRSDLQLTYDAYVETGNYYNRDGTWSIAYNAEKCIGIVFKTGADSTDHPRNYDGKLSGNRILGYVVALADAATNACTWGKLDTDTELENAESRYNTAYNGYRNTEHIIGTYRGGKDWNKYAAFKTIFDYRSKTTAPANTSDWYLPSLKQLSDIYNLYQNETGNILYDKLNAISPANLFRDPPVFGWETEPGGYWSSTEYSGWSAWYIRLTNGTPAFYAKAINPEQPNFRRLCYVRAILTF